MKSAEKSRQLVFIDDSGDPGFKVTSSTSFVMAAVVFNSPEMANLLSCRILKFHKSLGWRDNYEFKFAKIRKDIIINLLHIVSTYDFQIYSTYINKATFRNVAQVFDHEKLYNWSIKELLETIPLHDAKIKIDGRSSKNNMRKTATYLRRNINSDNSRKFDIRFEDSMDNNLIQLADLIAGSINRYLCGEKTDSGAYFALIRNKITVLKELK